MTSVLSILRGAAALLPLATAPAAGSPDRRMGSDRAARRAIEAKDLAR
jgi:hypothetical protein